MSDGDRSSSKPSLAEIFLTFFRLGLTAFGGPAMAAYIQEKTVKQKKWVQPESFKRGIGLCQSIPGATMMQLSAYIGFRVQGIWGAVGAYVGFGLPSFILMVIFSILYQNFHDIGAILSVFTGLQVIVVAMMANGAVNFGRTTIKNWPDILLGCAAAAFLILGGSPILAVVLAGFLGALIYKGMAIPPAGKSPVSPKANGSAGLGPAVVMLVLTGLGLALLFFLQRNLFDLAALMLKVDLFAFGGGFASLPIMLHEVVEVRQWMDSKTFMDGIALGQITPGPIVITAAFVGYHLSGIWGALIGIVSIFTPSLILLTAVLPYFDRLRHSAAFQRALRGILVSFVGLLAAVTIKFFLAAPWTWFSVPIAVLAFLALRFKIDIIWVVLVGAAVSAVVL